MAAKPYDRAQVLQVAAKLYPYFAEQMEAGVGEEDMGTAAKFGVQAARILIDEVERQCPLPGKPEPRTIPIPESGRNRG